MKPSTSIKSFRRAGYGLIAILILILFPASSANLFGEIGTKILYASAFGTAIRLTAAGRPLPNRILASIATAFLADIIISSTIYFLGLLRQHPTPEGGFYYAFMIISLNLGLPILLAATALSLMPITHRQHRQN
jgi:hypothetical protein